MRSAAQVTASLLFGRSSDLLGSSRLPPRRNPRGEGRDLPAALPRLSARGRDPAVRVPARHRSVRRCAERLDLRRLFRRRTLQLDPHQRADVRMADVAVDRIVRRCSSPAASIAAKSSSIRRVSLPIPKRPSGFPELPYLTRAAGLHGLRVISTPISAWRSCAPSTRRSIAGCSCTRPWPSRACFRACIKPVGLMAADFRDDAGTGVRRASRSCVRALSSGGCCSSAPASAIRPDARWSPSFERCLDRPEFLNRPDRGGSRPGQPRPGHSPCNGSISVRGRPFGPCRRPNG